MIKNAQEIHDSANIVSIVGQYVDLKPAGVNFSGLCPFHDEKTASFSVSPSKNICKCFGCGEGGDAVNFLKKHLGLTYVEALEKAAQISGISVEYESNVNREKFLQDLKIQNAKKKSTIDVLNKAYEIYESHRPKSYKGKIKLYNEKRYNVDTIKAFRISVNPNKNLLAKSKELDKQKLHDAGWLATSTHSTPNDVHYYDFFNSRILFPITDIKNNVLGITARTQDPNEKKYKYLNSKESDVFQKREILYGLPQALKAIRKRDFVYIVEGATDVVGMYDVGIQNVVGTLGTALTAEHAKLLSRYTDKATLAFDGDALNKKVLFDAIQTLMDQKMIVQILELPADHDPDSYAREHGIEGWKELCKTNWHDAVLWRIKKLPLFSPHQKIEAQKIAAQLISKIDSDAGRNMYCKDVAKLLEISSRDLKKEIDAERDVELANNRKFTPAQELSIQKFQTYIQHNKYYKTTFGKGFEISNFIIKPIMLIRAKEYSIRLVEIINEMHQSEVVEINSDDFVNLGTFRKKVEALGNNVFHGADADFMKVKMMVYENTPVCYPITTMGFHRRGFYAWGNGVTTPDGGFIPVNKYGTLTYEDKQYYLESFSEIKLNIESDEISSEDDPGTFHKYVKMKKSPTFEQWAKQFLTVFGDNGMIAICYYLATVYRDIIFSKLRFFPHLNLFGPPGSGKTFMGWRLIALFGELRDPVSLPNASAASLSRRPAQCRNMFCWLDEYTQELKPQIMELLKSFADGTGRALGKKTMDNKTRSTPVNSSIIISGQVLPNQDPALLTRCLTLFFEPISTDKKQDAEAAKLMEWEDGRLTQITAHLHTLRPIIEKSYSETFKDVKETIKQNTKQYNPIDRVLNTYTMMATMHSLLKNELNIPIKTNRLFDFITDRIASQVENIKGSNEINVFWNLIKFLIEQGLLNSDQYIVQKVSHVKIQNTNDQPEPLDFNEAKKIIFLRFETAFGLYREHARKQGAKRILTATDLKYYLRISPQFVGLCKAKKFDGKSKRSWMFYADQLPVELDENAFKQNDGFNEPPSGEIPYNGQPDIESLTP